MWPSGQQMVTTRRYLRVESEHVSSFSDPQMNKTQDHSKKNRRTKFGANNLAIALLQTLHRVSPRLGICHSCWTFVGRRWQQCQIPRVLPESDTCTSCVVPVRMGLFVVERRPAYVYLLTVYVYTLTTICSLQLIMWCKLTLLFNFRFILYYVHVSTDSIIDWYGSIDQYSDILSNSLSTWMKGDSEWPISRHFFVGLPKALVLRAWIWRRLWFASSTRALDWNEASVRW